MKSTPSHPLRIIDANINRTGEGLRVLEEFARLALSDTALTGRIKNMRHAILHIDAALQRRLISARNAAGDVGAGMTAAGDEKRRDPSETIIANARRVQESLRVLEEIAKEPAAGLESGVYEKARFELYTIEKELLSKMLRQDKVKRLTGLYVIVDVETLNGRSPVDATGAAIRGGAKIIQLRDKKDSRRNFYRIAEELSGFCKAQNALFIVNDSLEVALAVDADGLNIGQEDMPVAEARRLLPVDKLLGASASTIEEAGEAKAAGADYLGVGAIYITGTKYDIEVVGPGRIKEIKKAVNLPVVAIGGINRDNISGVMKAGADAAAVISAVMGARDIEKATRQLVEIIKGGKRG
jgi:thiamine-phosphate pyrophosphorylase